MEKKKIEVIPYLEFKGNCEEAINAYIEAFGGEIYGISHWPENTTDVTSDLIGKVMHAEFAIGKTHMSAGDGDEYGGAKTGIKLMIHMDSEAEALHALSVLTEGGTLLSPLHPHPDNSGYGSCAKDRFGYIWIITCPNPAKQ